MSRWTHRTPTDHEPDPHYNINGKPAWWTCHVKVGKDRCDGPLLLDGKRPPITGAATSETSEESPMSAQP